MRILFLCAAMILCLFSQKSDGNRKANGNYDFGDFMADSMIEEIADRQWDKRQYESAIDLYQTVPGTEEKLQKKIEELYETGVRTMRRGDFSAAQEIFLHIPDHADSAALAASCSTRMQMGRIPEGERLLTEESVIEQFPEGKLYLHPEGYLYVPDLCDENTSCCIYFAGGEEGDWLYKPGVYYYLKNYCPNAMILYFFQSGYKDKDKKIDTAAEIVQQMALEIGITLHDVSTVGSSHGCYTALRASARLYTEHGIPIKETVLLDAGMEWDVPASDLPTESEIAARRETGTKLMLFEQKYAMKNRFIQDLIRRGEDVYMVICRVSDHNNISAFAYYRGAFSWVVGDDDFLNKKEYHVIHFTKRDLKKYPLDN